MSALRWLGVEQFTVKPYAVDAYPRADVLPAGLRHVAIVDVETLGLEPTAPVIEIAVRRVAYNPATGELYGRVEDDYAMLNDPGVPIPPEITKLTGITDQDVRACAIDRERVREMLLMSNLVVSHNAAFDRPHVEALIGEMTKPWACSCSMVDWRGHGLPSAVLGALSLAHGFYCTAHRALGDVAALSWLLSHVNAETAKTYFAELLEEARLPVVDVFARGAPYEVKDRLKARGYRWRGGDRVWAKTVYTQDAEAEIEWLKTTSYARDAFAEPIDPRKRFRREA